MILKFDLTVDIDPREIIELAKGPTTINLITPSELAAMIRAGIKVGGTDE